jgi:dihydrofolate reductase
MTITIIAALSENRVLGKDNQLVWHMPNDFKRFKALTRGHHVIMGRRTYESLDKPLPLRTNIVITRQDNYQAGECVVVQSMAEALAAVKDDDQPFIIGGAEIYKLGLAVADKMELTLVESSFEGDTFFPEFSAKNWELNQEEKHLKDEKNPYNYRFLTYHKK